MTQPAYFLGTFRPRKASRGHDYEAVSMFSGYDEQYEMAAKSKKAYPFNLKKTRTSGRIIEIWLKGRFLSVCNIFATISRSTLKARNHAGFRAWKREKRIGFVCIFKPFCLILPLKIVRWFPAIIHEIENGLNTDFSLFFQKISERKNGWYLTWNGECGINSIKETW